MAAPTTAAAVSPSAATVDLRTRLALAARDLGRTSYAIVEVDDKVRSVWEVHGPSKSFRTTPSSGPGGAIQIGGEQWTTGVVAGGGGTRWIKMPKSAVWPMPDVVATRLVAAATGLTETAPGTFTGSVPEQVCRDVMLFTVDTVQLVIADPPKPVRWAETGTITVRLDERGRFAGLTVEVASADGKTAKKVAQTYRDYGKVGRPAKPEGALELPAFPE
ncbi:hypothetical protein GCM10009687_00860 [Asanoa iriomotensis]